MHKRLTMKQISIIVAAAIFALGCMHTTIGLSAELRLRTDARPTGGVVRLGDVADILNAGESEAAAR